MENIYHEGWEQELVYQFLPYDRCKKRAYICSPLSADTNEGIAQNMQATRAYMFYAMKKMSMNASAPHAYLPMILCDNIPSDRALALQFGLELLKGSDILLICGNRISSGMRGEINLLKSLLAMIRSTMEKFSAPKWSFLKRIPNTILLPEKHVNVTSR